MSPFRIQLVGLLILAACSIQSGSQDAKVPRTANPVPQQEPAIVTSVKIVTDRGAPAIEVVSSHQVVPTVQSLDSPPRIVIDLANARVGALDKKIPVLQQDMLKLRTEQYQADPPVTRIVLDLLVPYGFTWDIANNRLMVRLNPPENKKAVGSKSSPQPPGERSLAGDASPAVVPVTGGVGEVVLANKRFAAGSSITAGSETAVLQLSRGGQVLVCPGTTISVTPSNRNKDLMLGLGTGALETHYSIDNAADTVLTPDFRILFNGPGQFHYAVSTDSHGNTCVRGLKGNSSSATVSELIGERSYQVKSSEQAVFHGGRIDKVDADIPLECGCPPPLPALRTDAAPSKTIPEAALPDKITTASEASPPSKALQSGSQPGARPAPDTNQVHVQVDAPLVFNAKDRAAAAPPTSREVAALPAVDSSVRTVPMQIQVQPPESSDSQAPSGKGGVLHRIKHFFGSIFH